MTDKHTPGPWEFEAGETLSSVSTYVDGEYTGIAYLTLPNHQANARLSAAAPDLLGALRANGAWLDRWASHVGSCNGGMVCTCGLTLAKHENRAAIAKATGADT